MGSFTLSREPLRSRPVLEGTLFKPSDDGTDEVQELAEQVERLQRKLRAVMHSSSLDPETVRAAISHTRLVCLPAGYRLAEVDDPPPALDDLVEHDGATYTVWRLGPSSFPDDPRRCAILMPVSE